MSWHCPYYLWNTGVQSTNACAYKRRVWQPVGRLADGANGQRPASRPRSAIDIIQIASLFQHADKGATVLPAIFIPESDLSVKYNSHSAYDGLQSQTAWKNLFALASRLYICRFSLLSFFLLLTDILYTLPCFDNTVFGYVAERLLLCRLCVTGSFWAICAGEIYWFYVVTKLDWLGIWLCFARIYSHFSVIIGGAVVELDLFRNIVVTRLKRNVLCIRRRLTVEIKYTVFRF